MRINVIKALLSAAAMFCLVTLASDVFYVVKKGDTLSSILLKKEYKQLYGKNGAIAHSLQLNPHLKKSRGDKIYPNMQIRLVDEKVAEIKIQVPKNEEKFVINRNESTNQRTPANNFNQRFFWEIGPSVSWKSLSSTDENAYRRSKINALSKTNYGVTLSYGMHYSERIDIYSRIFLESVSFSPDRSVNLLKKKFISSSLSVGVSHERVWFLEIGMSDGYFLTSPSTLTVDIKKITLPEIKAGHVEDFYLYQEAKLAYSLSASAFLPRESEEIKTDFSYGAGAALEAKLRNQSFKIGFDFNLLKSSGNSTNNQNIYWKYVWETL